MGVGRVLGTVTAAVTVAGCAAVVVGMARANADKQHAAEVASARYDLRTSAATTSVPAQLPPASGAANAPDAVTGQRVGAGAAAAVPSATSTTAVPSTAKPATTKATKPAPTTAAQPATSPGAKPAPTTARGTVPATTPRPTPRATTTTKAAPRITTRTTTSSAPRTTAPKPVAAAPRKGVKLPLGFGTGSATRVITVKAAHTWSTTATLQAWTKAPGGGWLRYGGAVTAHLGSQGMTWSPSESKSATPIGSYTLTRAFGHYGNPGTRLPYVHTTPADWWISQSGPLYNTLQHCSSHCAFNQGSPNEHLYYETPYYNYAVVIDYNTRNTGHVRQGAGSAFFLHVTDGGPTAGCVSISQSKLISLMRWLTPAAHPRILIGT